MKTNYQIFKLNTVVANGHPERRFILQEIFIAGMPLTFSEEDQAQSFLIEYMHENKSQPEDKFTIIPIYTL